ncbi:MAG: hypothetical protein ACYC6N_26140 [Pirellulaceae bacterium]
MGTINDWKGLSILIDVGKLMGDGQGLGVPIYAYRSFRREQGMTVEEPPLWQGRMGGAWK